MFKGYACALFDRVVSTQRIRKHVAVHAVSILLSMGSTIEMAH